MLDIRLIAADMDGTLLGSDGKISPRTLKAIRKAQEKGIIFTICTGRFPEHCLAFANDAGIRCSVISSNGGSVYDGQSGCVIARHLMSGESAWQVWQVIRRYPIRCMATLPGCYVNRCEDAAAAASHYEKINQIMCRDYGILHETGEDAMDFRMHQRIYKTYINGFADALQREQVRKELEKIPGISVTSSGPRNIETMPIGVDKGTGLKELASAYGIPMENVMVFGDFDNDIPMFRCAGYPIAMGNATDSVKQIARQTTAANTEDGLAQAIEKYILDE